MKKVFCLIIAVLLSASSIVAQTAVGTDFWLTFDKKAAEYYDGAGLQICIAAENLSTTGTLEFTNLGISMKFDILAKKAYSYTLTKAEAQAALTDGVHITANHPVMAYATAPMGNVNVIQSKYIQLNNGGGAMRLLGDPNGAGNFVVVNPFTYNYQNSNKCLIYTGLAVPDTNHPGQYLTPKMIMINPSDSPNKNAFTVNNVMNQNMLTLGGNLNFPQPSNSITYHDKIDGATGLFNPDGVFDGFTGFTTIDGFLIEHTAQIRLNTYTGNPDCIEFFFTVTNTSSEARVFGLSWNVDTYIGPDIGPVSGGDLAPFHVVGIRKFTIDEVSVGFPIPVGSAAETFYDSKSLFQLGFNPYPNSVPDYFYALNPDDDWSALVKTNLGFRNGILWQKADYVAMSHYTYIMLATPYFLFGVNNGQPVGQDTDSGHMLRWDPQVVKPGETIHLAFSYGAGNAENVQPGVINFMDQMAPAIIETDVNKRFYTNAPFTSITTIVNQTLANVLSGTVTLKIPRAHLKVENDMLANNWVQDLVASGNDPNNDYYTYTVGTVGPLETHEVYPPVHLDVIPQYIADVNTTYWLILDVQTDIPVEVIPDTIVKKLFIPKLEGFIVTLSANPKIGGTVDGEGIYNLDELVTVTATPEECWKFVNWTENGIEVSKNNPYQFNITESRDLVANFALDYYNVTVSASPTAGGTVTGNGNYACGAPVTVTAVADNCYTFVNWTEGGIEVCTNPAYPFTISESRTLTANFEQKLFDIEVSANPQAGGTVTGNEIDIPCGEYRTVTAIEDKCYTFINWTENGSIVSSDAEYPFVVERSRILTANFEKTLYRVIVEVNPEEHGAATGSGLYGAFTQVQVEALETSCYRFKEWTIDDKVVSTAKLHEFTITDDVAIVANFYALDFETYSPTLWNNTFMLDLKSLKEEGYDVIGCKWYKNGIEETDTRTIDEFSYSAGPEIFNLLEFAPTYYMFRLITENYGELCSTLKMIEYDDSFPNPNIWAYPNPITSGVPFAVKGVAKNDEIRVYNQCGICVHSAIANGETIVLSLNVQAGVYVVRANGKWVKVVIIK